MIHAQITAVEHFAHELAAPLFSGAAGSAGQAASRVADIRAGTRRMSEAVDTVVAHFSPPPGQGEAEREASYKVVDALVAMTSAGIAAMAAEIDGRDKGRDGGALEPILEAMWDAHDAWVRDYYRLICLRADLDPESRPVPGGPVLDSSKAVQDWAEGLFASADAEG